MHVSSSLIVDTHVGSQPPQAFVSEKFKQHKVSDQHCFVDQLPSSQICKQVQLSKTQAACSFNLKLRSCSIIACQCFCRNQFKMLNFSLPIWCSPQLPQKKPFQAKLNNHPMATSIASTILEVLKSHPILATFLLKWYFFNGLDESYPPKMSHLVITGQCNNARSS